MGHSNLPKVLVHLAGMPLISHLLREINQLALDHKPIIVVGHRYELVQSALGDKYVYALQPGQLGTAHAVEAAKKQATGKNLLVLYGDMPLIDRMSLQALIDHHEKTSAIFSMFTASVPHFENEFRSYFGFGRIIRDAQGFLKEIRELLDCSEEQTKITEINPGIYIFKSAWLWDNIGKIKQNKRGEYYLTDIIAIAADAGAPIQTLRIDPGQVFGINTPEQLKFAETMIHV